MIIKRKYDNRYYPQYFYPEIENFIKDEKNVQKCSELPENYEEKRLIGENNNPICELIRKDSIDEFISCAKQTNMSLKGDINTSIYDTNTFLLGRNITLIQYAAFFGATQIFKYSSFFGSIQIFRYLYQNIVVLTSSLWLYSMHGQSQEIINILNENMIISQDKQFNDIVNESIKCHHIEVTNYICNNLFDENMPNILNDKKFGNESIKHYNFIFFPRNQSLKNYLYYFCRYGYTSIVKLLLRDQSVNVNQIEPIYEIFLLIFFLMKHHSFLLLKIET